MRTVRGARKESLDMQQLFDALLERKGDSATRRDGADKAAGGNTPTITAVPAGEWWRIKAVSQGGETTLLGQFDGCLPALGAAVLDEQVGGRVVP